MPSSPNFAFQIHILDSPIQMTVIYTWMEPNMNIEIYFYLSIFWFVSERVWGNIPKSLQGIKPEKR